MQTIEIEIFNAITKNAFWIIILLILIFVFCTGIYSLQKKLIKLEKEKNEDREILLGEIRQTNELLSSILTNQITYYTNQDLKNMNNNFNDQQQNRW